MMGARLLLALLFAIHLSELVSCCKREITNCKDGRYKGPIRKVIDNGPTRMAQASDNHGKYLLSIVEPILSSAIGEAIPFGGLVYGVINSIRAAINGPTEDPYSALLKKLYEEVKQLKKYVDEKIQLVALTALDNYLGGKHAGIFGRVQDAREAETTEELWKELEQLQGVLQDNHDHFLPSTDDIVSYERSLPFFRIFGDLFMSCLLDQLQAAKELGYKSDIADIVKEIQIRADTFSMHYTKAVNAIVRSHTNLDCKDRVFLHPLLGLQIKCSVEVEGEVCSVNSIGCSNRDKVWDLVKRRSRAFKENRRRDLLNYWREQVGNVVQKWNSIAKKVKNQVAEVMALTEEDRKAFAAKEGGVRLSLPGIGQGYKSEITHEYEDQPDVPGGWKRAPIRPNVAE